MDFERRALQVVVAIGALIPLSAGLYGGVAGGALTDDLLSPSGDSHYRYLSGLLVGIGLGFLSAIPEIENQTTRVRMLTAIVVIGGLFRVMGLASMPRPSGLMFAAAIMEVVVTPSLCLWQARIAGRFIRA